MVLNFSIYSIPVYWVMGLWPHIHGVRLIKKANNKKWDNCNPRGVDTAAKYQKSVPAEVFAKFERAEAAHKNMMENAPLFIGAVIAGNIAGLPASTLNAATGVYLALRIVYIGLYIKVTRQKYSYLRTTTWFIFTAVLFGLFIKASNKLAYQD
ncbi:hypothetical protein K469DRAFT_735448 [Zopfia rhizophila CBS 207.26]|uniref:Membrane-associated proteins in eicosanoid and glutathione metabolism n=1 Tax=Zopfia rhizophila CBS 207.26 TaxID=1314779 RepID=A0A6A6EMQ7_9PEZI|nr:hypothetical protein K469DRAFT_735448 [Zopfia rhizophila CBS 207.26]